MQVQKKDEKAPTKQLSPIIILDRLTKERAKIDRLINSISEPNAIIRCEVLRAMFDDLMPKVKDQIVPLEQSKGIRKGMDLSLPMILQHIEIQKKTLNDIGQTEKLKFAIQIIQDCARSVIEASKQQGTTVARRGGHFDGVVNSAMAITEKIKAIVENTKRLYKVARELEEEDVKNAEVDEAFEQRAEVRREQIEAEKEQKASAVEVIEVPQTPQTLQASQTLQAQKKVESGNNGIKKNDLPKPLKPPKKKARKTRKHVAND
jgi:hypothetical protein